MGKQQRYLLDGRFQYLNKPPSRRRQVSVLAIQHAYATDEATSASR